MKKLKTFAELSKNIDTLTENAKGQLKGGFVVLSLNELTTVLDDDVNLNCPTNNCDCKNKNTNKECSGCSGTVSHNLN